MRSPSICALLLIGLNPASALSGECDGFRERHPEWIFCDDFEDTGSLVKTGRYFEYDDNDGDFANVGGAGLNGSRAMRVRFQEGEVSAGSLKLAFGRNPVNYMNKQGIRPDEDFREIYYRMYLRMKEGWSGSPAKLSRATCFPDAADWRQAMIAHLWSDDREHLLIDPASCVDDEGNVVCAKYNDFDRLNWLGNKAGTTPIFSSVNSGRWWCIEAHVKLNDPAQSNGVQEFWVDGNLEAARTGLDFIGTFDRYAINAVFFENYWNSGSPKLQERFFDNIVVSTRPIGCYDDSRMRYAPERARKGNERVRIACTGNSMVFTSCRSVARVRLLTGAGRKLADRVIDGSHTFSLGAPDANGVVLYEILFTDKEAAACLGIFVKR